eukprot:CAMPEP_0206255224 /NCGR_PEP_ID=MMETSP0047_2-20121206/24129_1 /ASSEMBLY_ACC=CAM_ASM_000192 /TAXON_ID=195065 /ORGANISM="Chroomonas mesostigmatica_cf, Strain CCMP1168" /LENGTH=352 /DNA_ID=CAMNT_0053681601 /DNA_START=60 /DNA_END=1116 /DNA_ORIENTATION=+
MGEYQQQFVEHPGRLGTPSLLNANHLVLEEALERGAPDLAVVKAQPRERVYDSPVGDNGHPALGPLLQPDLELLQPLSKGLLRLAFVQVLARSSPIVLPPVRCRRGVPPLLLETGEIPPVLAELGGQVLRAGAHVGAQPHALPDERRNDPGHGRAPEGQRGRVDRPRERGADEEVEGPEVGDLLVDALRLPLPFGSEPSVPEPWVLEALRAVALAPQVDVHLSHPVPDQHDLLVALRHGGRLPLGPGPAPQPVAKLLDERHSGGAGGGKAPARRAKWAGSAQERAPGNGSHGEPGAQSGGLLHVEKGAEGARQHEASPPHPSCHPPQTRGSRSAGGMYRRIGADPSSAGGSQ